MTTSEIDSLQSRLRGQTGEASELCWEAATEIVRLRKVVDALTVKLNKVLNEQYVGEALLKERCDSLEHRLARMATRVEQLRYVKEAR